MLTSINLNKTHSFSKGVHFFLRNFPVSILRKRISIFIFFFFVFLFCAAISLYSKQKDGVVVQSRYENKVSTDTEGVRTERSTYYTKVKLELEEGFEFSFAAIRRQELSESDYSLFSLGFYLSPHNTSNLTMLAVGNYILSIGQELVFGSPYYSSIHYITNAPFKKSGSGINSYVYPGSLGSLMGGAFSLSFGNIKVLSFVFENNYPLSMNKFSDGAFDIDYEYLITSTSPLQYDNAKEIKELSELGFGVDISYEARDFDVGLLLSYTILSDNLTRSELYLDKNVFSSNELFLGSFHFDASINKHINIYGEFALSSYYDFVYGDRQYGFAALFGTIMRYHFFSFMFLFRYLDENYHAPHSSEVISVRIDEVGFSSGIALDLVRGLFLQFLFDVFKPVSLLDNKSLWYYDYSMRLIYEPIRGLHLSYFFGERFKSYYSTMRDRRKHQLNIKYSFYDDRISIKFRYENIYSKRLDDSVGYLGDLFYLQSKFGISKYYSFFTRITYYKAEDYTASIYVYEPHLPYWYSGPTAFNGNGIKFDFTLKMYFAKLTFGIRYSIDFREDYKEYNNLFANLVYRF